MPDIAQLFVDMVNSMRSDIDSIYEEAIRDSMSDWELKQKAMVSASGAASVAVPGLHLAGLAADAAFVINRMGTSAFGVGAIMCHLQETGNILEEEDFAAILGYWSDDKEIKQAMKGKAAADLSSKVGLKIVMKSGGKLAVKGLTKTMMASVGYLAASRLGAKAAAKPAAKFAAKFGGKALGGFVPFLGPVVGGGINLWLISTIISASHEFYTDKIDLAKRLA